MIWPYIRAVGAQAAVHATRPPVEIMSRFSNGLPFDQERPISFLQEMGLDLEGMVLGSLVPKGTPTRGQLASKINSSRTECCR